MSFSDFFSQRFIFASSGVTTTGCLALDTSFWKKEELFIG
jgi:hypothetical protein